MKEIKLNLLDQIHQKVLESEFSHRKKDDISYSIRKFAQDAQINSSTMSQFLNGSRKLTTYKFDQILQNLNVKDQVLIDYKKDMLELEQLQEKHQAVKTDWYYYAILELTNLVDFEPNPEWISNNLGLCLKTTKAAIELLFEIGAMIKEDGTWKDTLGNITFVDSLDMDNHVGRIHQKQLIEKAIFSIENISGELKDHTGVCFAFDNRLTPELKKMISAFGEEVAHFIETNSKENNSVYTLQMNLNPITK